MAEKCHKKSVAFQLGVSHMSPVISLERLKRVKSLEPGAVQVILPDWFPVTEPEMLSFLQKMSQEAEPVALVLYNPPHAKKVLTPKQLCMLHQLVPQLVGIKVAGGDETWYDQMKEALDEITVFVPGHRLATGYSKGAKGAYSNVACLSPKGAQQWYERMKINLFSALEQEKQIQKFMSQYITPFITKDGYMNGAVDKLLCAIGGWSEISTRMRWPYRFIPMDQVGELRKIAKKMLPEMFVSIRDV